MTDSQMRQAKIPDKLVESMLQVNQLLYKLPPQISICSSRKYQTDYFQQSAYTPSQNMVLTAQTGSSYVDPMNSYFIATLTTPQVGGADSTAGFGTGSFLNLFNIVQVKPRSGKEWSRSEQHNVYANKKVKWSCGSNYYNTVGMAMGFPFAGANNDGALSTISSTIGQTFVIPLQWLSPCFNQSKFLPSLLMEGLRIDIKLESFANAMIAGNATSYTINNPRIVWDTYNLEDSFRAKMQEIAGSRGLNLIHKEVYHQQFSGTSLTTLNTEVNKAASAALSAFVVTRPQTGVATSFSTDKMASEAYDYSTQSYHVGADYFPVSPLDTSISQTIAGNVESYYNALYAFDKLKTCWNPSAVTPISYTGSADLKAGGSAVIRGNDAISAVCLNKSGVTDLDGYKINTARSLYIDIRYATSADRTIDIYLEFLRAIKIYLTNVDIKD